MLTFSSQNEALAIPKCISTEVHRITRSHQAATELLVSLIKTKENRPKKTEDTQLVLHLTCSSRILHWSFKTRFKSHRILDPAHRLPEIRSLANHQISTIWCLGRWLMEVVQLLEARPQRIRPFKINKTPLWWQAWRLSLLRDMLTHRTATTAVVNGHHRRIRWITPRRSVSTLQAKLMITWTKINNESRTYNSIFTCSNRC